MVQFKFLLRRFIPAVCCPSGPLVLIQDDLQWADPTSLELIKVLASNRDLSGLFFVGCYRDNEVKDGDHPFQVWLRELEGHEVPVSHLGVSNLSVAMVNSLLVETMLLDKHETEGLASLIHRRPMAMPFLSRRLFKIYTTLNCCTFV
jgi:predicted ATPase